MSSPTSSSSSSNGGGLNGLGPALRRDVAGLSHRLSVLKAGLADLAASGCARAAASEACQGEVRTAQECLAEVKQVRCLILHLQVTSCWQIYPIY